ncbi:DUF5337 domain-containing protein [Roseibacterium sp. SDUM158016]|jgi:hypothetical protein|uniref:DUF5337 domain-containing protein n=1 Tax=Roseicyclus sediminis TaxID=2980997 RepID=UPI0021CF7C68|nr:DUF5337 domain-containing protein [Roseibacterium sp. SDUM158016]MCU4654606.1 DUF5337 domain-containing protein [Roseibacterium sp. SDUM158016]
MAQRPRKPIPEEERRRVRQIRLAAIVMAATMVLWVAGQFIGGQLGLPVRFAFLLDLAAIAALVWALVVTYWVWKERRRS